jgi:hypothetical protein
MEHLNANTEGFVVKKAIAECICTGSGTFHIGRYSKGNTMVAVARNRIQLIRVEDGMFHH